MLAGKFLLFATSISTGPRHGGISFSPRLGSTRITRALGQRRGSHPRCDDASRGAGCHPPRLYRGKEAYLESKTLHHRFVDRTRTLRFGRSLRCDISGESEWPFFSTFLHRSKGDRAGQDRSSLLSSPFRSLGSLLGGRDPFRIGQASDSLRLCDPLV